MPLFLASSGHTAGYKGTFGVLATDRHQHSVILEKKEKCPYRCPTVGSCGSDGSFLKSLCSPVFGEWCSPLHESRVAPSGLMLMRLGFGKKASFKCHPRYLVTQRRETILLILHYIRQPTRPRQRVTEGERERERANEREKKSKKYLRMDRHLC